MISMDVLTISEPSEASTRLKLPNAAFDVESEGLPRDSCVLPEPMIRVFRNLTSFEFEYQEGQASASTRLEKAISHPAWMSISLCAKRSACSGSSPPGPMNPVVTRCAVAVECKSLMCRHLRMTVHAEYCCSE